MLGTMVSARRALGGLLTWSFYLLVSISMATQSRAQQTFFPANVPLATRSTYMSCWVSTRAGNVYSHTWPTTSINPFAILGWGGLAKIDNTTYSWLGNPQNGLTANVSQFTVTPTRTIFTLLVPPMELNITFLSPIEPGDLVKQSIPFAYVTFEARSLDGATHSVEVYSDLSGEWISGDRGQTISWNTDSGISSVYHSASLENPQVFGNTNGQAQWGTLYHAAKKDSSTTWKVGADVDSRGLFAKQGSLDNGEDTNFRVISNNWPVFAISQNLGTISSTSSPVVWAVGFARDPAVSYTDVSGKEQQRHPYYQSNYSDISTLIEDFLDDFPAALQRAQALDAKILNAAASLMPGSEYSDLLSISTRQVYASTELTIGANGDGSWDTSDVMMFMRDTGDGNSERTNAVEILYAAFPTFMYIDPPLGAALLEPLLRIQNTSDFGLPYAAPDLTSAYPNVTVSTSPHNQGVEQSGNMIIMAYAYSRASGDGSLIGRYYPLFKKWSDYLVNNTLDLSDQVSSDNTITRNQTNLAIKGIIAVQAMSCISKALGRTADANTYSAQAKNLYSNWTSLALSDSQDLLVAYGQKSTWSIGYNLFADRWLGTNVVNSSVFAAQGSSMLNLVQTSGDTNFGLPVDSTSTNVIVSSWDMFAAAMTNNSDARSAIVTRIHNRASLNASGDAFPLTWESQQGSSITGVASPAQGAVYAPLVLTVPERAVNGSGFASPDSAPGGPPSGSHAGAIAGGVIGGLVGVAILGFLGFWIWRRRKYRFIPAHVDPLVTEDVYHRPQPSQMQFEPLNGLAVGADGRYNVASQRGGGGAAASAESNSRSHNPQSSSGGSSSTPGHVAPSWLWMNGQMREAPRPMVSPQGPRRQTDEPHQPPPQFLSAKTIVHLRAMNLDAAQSEAALMAPPAPPPRSEAPQTQGGVNPSLLETQVMARQLREEVANVVQEILGERLELPPSYNEDAAARGPPSGNTPSQGRNS